MGRARKSRGCELLDGRKYRLVAEMGSDAYARAAERVADIMARTDEYSQAPAEGWQVFELSGAFSDVVKLPRGTRERLAAAYPGIEDLDALLEASWGAALRHRALRRDDEGSLAFPLPLPMTSYAGHPAEVVVAPSRYRDAALAWYAPYCSYRRPGSAAQPVFAFGASVRGAVPVSATDDEARRILCAQRNVDCAKAAGGAGNTVIPAYTPASYVEKRALLDYAWLGNEAETLGKLARMAAPEDWDDGCDGELGVLRNYLFGTFAAAQRQGLVLERPQDDFAAFNTGLSTRFGSSVVMCFRVNRVLGRQEWAFAFFAEPGVGRAGKRLLEVAGSELPAAPTLPKARFGGEAVYADYRHLAMRLFRLPARWVREALDGCDEALDLLASALAEPGLGDGEKRFEKLSAYVLGHEDAATLLRERLGRAVAASQERWSADPSLAAANYNPERGTASVLLPLWFSGDEEPDAALIASPVEGGCWQGHTVVTLRQAYRTARISGSHRTPWLARAAESAETRRAREDEERRWAEVRLAQRAAERAAREAAAREAEVQEEAACEKIAACEQVPPASPAPLEPAGARREERAPKAGAAGLEARGFLGRLAAILIGTPTERRERALSAARYHTA